MEKLFVEVLRQELGWQIPFLHGGLTHKRRDEIVDSFQINCSIGALILSIRTGGTGLKITAASQVNHYDFWWKPSVEAQATDQAFRIGQQITVLVHRLITKKIDAMNQNEKELADLTVSNRENGLLNFPMTSFWRYLNCEKINFPNLN